MSQTSGRDGPPSFSVDAVTGPPGEFFEALATEHRRAILSLLLEEGPVAEDELARRVVEGEREGSPGTGADAGTERVRALHYHRDLPKLTAAGLVERGQDGTFDAVDDPRLEHPTVGSVLRGRTSLPPSVVDATFRLLASERRQTVLSLLKHHRTVDRDELAEAVTTSEYGTAVSEEEIARIRVELRHSDLPALADADVVTVEENRERLGYVGNRLLDDEELLSETAVET